MEGKKSKYITKPQIPPSMAVVLEIVLRVLTSQVQYTQAAQAIGVSRHQMHVMCNRCLHALVEVLTPRKAGRPRTSEEVLGLRRELRDKDKTIRMQNSQIAILTNQRDALMLVARARSHRPAGHRGQESDEVTGCITQCVGSLIAAGLRLADASAVLDRSESTLRRWMARARDGLPLVLRRGPAPSVGLSDALVAHVEEILKATRGRLGARVLGKMSGGSRRACDAIKKNYLRLRERARKSRSMRVRISAPGIVRSFDQLCIRIAGIQYYALICADACVPFRTTIAFVRDYDAMAVMRVIAQDIEKWGAPLVWRFDRAACHLTKDVTDLLLSNGVLPLCGPAYHPQYYGQMERMNREHRQWLRDLRDLTERNIECVLADMRNVLNEYIIRPILGCRTAAAVWGEREPPSVDRDELLQEVRELAATKHMEIVGHIDAGHASWRYGVETALTNRGLLSVEKGASC